MDPIDKKINNRKDDIEEILDEWGFSPSSFGIRDDKRKEIIRWFHNFQPSEVDDAFLILSETQYHETKRVNAYIKILSEELKSLFNNNFENVRLFPLGNTPSSSGGKFLYDYRKDLGLPENVFPNESIDKVDLSGIKAVIFFDDIIGSGSQAIRFAKKKLKSVEIDKYYLALLAFDKGLKKLKDTHLFKEIIVAKELTEEYKAFSPESEVFSNEEERERLKLMCIKYGEKLYPEGKHGEGPLGYDDSQALIIFDHNVPNNTLPIIWASPNNEKAKGVVWNPLWERKSKSDSNIAVKIAYKSTYAERPKSENTIKENLDLIRNHPSLRFYIPLNCGETIYSRKSDNDLEQEVNKSLNGTSSVLLLLGDSGSGKSTFCNHLTLRLINEYQENKNAPLPVLIKLGSSLDAINRGRIIEDEFERIGLSIQEISDLQKNKEFVFILDGYDELELDREDKHGMKKNIFTTNRLSEWKAKVIITCRAQILEDNEDYRSRFCREDTVSKRPDRDSLKTLYVVPFSDEKVESYLKKYAPSECSEWKDWMQFKEEITRLYNLRELAANPLLLSIITQTLPKARFGGDFTRAKLYQEFFEQWFEREKAKLKIKTFFRFAEKLSFRMFLEGKIEIEYEKEDDEGELSELTAFFASNKPKDILARSGCPIQKTGDYKYRFMHKSFQEFCVARKLCGTLKENNWTNLNKRLLTQVPAILYFLSEMDITKENLLAVLDESKNNSAIETASSNAATILNAMRFPFSGLDLSCVRIPGSDLSDSVLHQTNLSKSNLSSVTFTNAFLKDADLSNSNMANVKFGEKPFLEGHNSHVWSVPFSPDGKIAASGSHDGTARLWDVESGKQIKILKGHDGYAVNSVSFSADGKMLASVCTYGTIRLWDVESGKLIKKLVGYGKIPDVSFSPDGRMLASTSKDNALCLWDVKSGKQVKELEGHSDSVKCVSFCPDGKILASGSEDKTIRLWDVEGEKLINTLVGHSNSVWRVSFSPNGKMLASGSHDGSVRLWDVESGKQIKILKGHDGDAVRSVSFSPDGKTLAHVSKDNAIRLWEVGSGKKIKTLAEHNDVVRNVFFSPNGKILASGSNGSYKKTIIRLWEVESEKLINTFVGHRAAVNSVSFSPDGKMLASGSEDKTIRLWDVESKKLINTLVGQNDGVQNLYFCPDGEILISESLNAFQLWKVKSGKLINRSEWGHRYVNSVSFRPEGKMIAIVDMNNAIHLCEFESRKLIKRLEGHSDRVNSVSFSLDGKMLASGSRDKTIRLWDIESGKLIKTLVGHNAFVHSVSFCSDSKILASGSEDHSVKLWNIADIKKDILLIWSSNFQLFCKGMNARNVKGLSETNRLLLTQRGAVLD